MQHHENKSNFMETVVSIKAAENDFEETLKEANSKAEGIMKKSKEAIAKMKAEAEQSGVSLKNVYLQKGRSSIEKEVEAMLGKAREQSSTYRNAKISQKDISELLRKFLEL